MSDTNIPSAAPTAATPATFAGAGETVTPPASNTPISGSTATPVGVDLTQFDEFRRVQSGYDREISGLKAQIAQLNQQLTAEQQRRQQRELANLDALDPAEQVTAYKQMLAEQQAEAARQAEAMRYVQQAQQVVANAGLRWDTDPRVQNLLSRISPNADGVAQLSIAVAQFVRDDANAQLLAAQKKAEEDVRRAAQAAQVQRVETIAASGVAATSVAAGAPPDANATRAQQIEQLRARANALKGKGVGSAELLRLRADMRALGIQPREIGM